MTKPIATCRTFEEAFSGPQVRRAGSAGAAVRPVNCALAEMYRLIRGRLPPMGVGGIASAEGAYAKICAGTRLVQLYTALVFAGPDLVGQIKTGLAELLERDGFRAIAQAVGNGAPLEIHASSRTDA